MSSPRIKILHLGKYFPPFRGGIESFMSQLVCQQNNHKIEAASLVHQHESSQIYQEEMFRGTPIYRVPILGKFAYTPISIKFGYYLNKIIKRHKTDLLHLHMPNVSVFWCLVLPSARKIPWVVHWHSDVIGNVPDFKIKCLYTFYRLFETAILNKASKIIISSAVYANSSKPVFKYKSKVEVVALGLEEKGDIKPMSKVANKYLNKRHLEAANVPLSLLMIGRLTYYKGHEYLLKAIAQLKVHNKILHLSIVGGGELKNHLLKLIEDLNLQSQVKLLGSLSNEQLKLELNTTDLLCLPSIERTEAFGVVLLEAMRASKPCLVTDVPGSGMSWVVQDGVTGFVVKHKDISALVNKLSYVLDNRNELNVLGQAGKKRFDQCFNIKTVAQKIQKIYISVLNFK